MARIHGKNGTIKLGATGGSDEVLAISDFSITETVPTAEGTAMGDTAQQHAAGIPGWTASVTCRMDTEDASGQGGLTIGATVTGNFYPAGDGTGADYLTGTAIVTSIGRTVAMSDYVSISFELLGNGALGNAVVA